MTAPTTMRRKVAGERSRRGPRPEPTVPTGRAPRTTEPDVAPSRPDRRGRRSRWALVAVAAVTALAVAAAVVLTLQARQAQTVADARTAAVQQATTAAEVILSYDHETLDDDFAAALELATGEFRQQYERTSEDAVRQVAVDTAAVVEAEVASAGVVSASVDEVVVLLFVNQTTTSNRLDSAQTDQNRVRMTMTREGDSWKVSAVDAL